MHFVITTERLDCLLGKCQSIVAQKSTIPIVGNVLLEAKNNELIVTATDLSVGMRCRTEAKILKEGSTTLPARKFAQLIRELSVKNVEIILLENDSVEIIANTSRFRLLGMPSSQFPELPDCVEATHLIIEKKKLQDLLSATTFAVAKQDNRYVLTGLSVNISESSALFLGTDGKRMARTQTKVEIDPEFKGKVIIPLKSVEEIYKNLQGDGKVTVHILDDKLAIESEDTLIVTKLLEGEYPDLTQVIPEKLEMTVTLHREEMMMLLRQIILFTADTSDSVRFTFSDGELWLTANHVKIGEGKVSMPVNWLGPKLEIAFNPHYFLEALKHSKEENVMLGLVDSYNPGVIWEGASSIPVSEASPLFVLMPMRLQ